MPVTVNDLEVAVALATKLPEDQSPLSRTRLPAPTKEVFEDEILVKVRSTGKLLRSKLNFKEDKSVLNLLEDEHGISPGQACVFYKKDINGYKVLGGGWITK